MSLIDEKDGMRLLSRYRGCIMGFAAIWIFVFHEWQLLFEGVPIISKTESFLKTIGFCGVDIFFLLSGIGLTRAIQKGSVLQFYYRRIKRMVLPFLLMAFLMLFVGEWTASDFFFHVTGWNFYMKDIYGFLWFVPAIVTLYLLFPLYYKFLSVQKQPLYFLIGMLSVWLFFSISLRETMRLDLYGFTNRIPVFLIGGYLGYDTQKRERISFTGGTWVLLTMLFLLGLYLAYVTNFQNYYLLVPVSNCCLPNLFIALSLPFLLAKGMDMLVQVRYLKFMGKAIGAVLAFYGMFSFEFYCIQEWLGGILIERIQYMTSPLLLNMIVFSAVTAAGFLLYALCRIFWKLADRGIAKIPCKK